jgi:hypothetical protein
VGLRDRVLIEDDPARAGVARTDLDRRQGVMMPMALREGGEPRVNPSVEHVPVEAPLEEAVEQLHGDEHERERAGPRGQLARPEIRGQEAEGDQEEGELQPDRE